jgi:hypothetical protein
MFNHNGRWQSLEQMMDSQESSDEPIEPTVERKKFCEFCDAKGPIKHFNNCTRNK